MIKKMTQAKLRIVIASDPYAPSVGGTETTTANIAHGLAGLGQEVVVIAPSQSWRRSYVEQDGNLRVLRVRSIPLPIGAKLRLSLWPYPVVKRFLDELKPDIVQANNPYSLGHGLFKYCKKHNVISIGGSHLMPESFLYFVRNKGVYDSLRMLGWRLVAQVYNRAMAVIGPTQTSVDYLVKGGLRAQTKVISNGVDIVANQPGFGREGDYKRQLKLRDELTVVYLGRLAVDKRIDVLIDAFSLLVKQMPARLILVGRGPVQGQLEAQTARLGLSDKVKFTGFVTNEQRKMYLLAADLFCIPSPVELQSIVTLEAMACGKPVVAVGEGALPEIVRPGENGQLFKSGDSSDLAKALEVVLGDRAKLEQYGRRSRQIAEGHDIRRMPQEYLDYYRSLLEVRA